MVFAKEAVEGTWKWGEHDLPTVAKYTYLGIDFASNGPWDGLDCEGQSVLLGGGKCILGCSSMDKAKLKWWYKLVTMPEDRYIPKEVV